MTSAGAAAVPRAHVSVSAFGDPPLGLLTSSPDLTLPCKTPPWQDTTRGSSRGPDVSPFPKAAAGCAGAVQFSIAI